MSNISERLPSLRQEIAELRSTNAGYSSKSEHSPIQRKAMELRNNRLLEIRQELSNMVNCPDHPAVWWEKFRKSTRAA